MLQIRAAALGYGGVILVGDPEMLRASASPLRSPAVAILLARAHRPALSHGVYCDNHHRESGKIFSGEQ